MVRAACKGNGRADMRPLPSHGSGRRHPRSAAAGLNRHLAARPPYAPSAPGVSARLEPQLERGHRVAVAILSRAPVATAVPVLVLHLALLVGWISGAWRIELTTRIKCNTAFCLVLAAAS